MIRRALRLVVAVGLATLCSGIAQAVTAGSDDCGEEHCEGSLGGKGCPPTCTLGACAKVKPAIDPARLPVVEAPAPRGWACAETSLLPALPLVTSGVFHPPQS
jgi:hypothetical protein